MSECKHLQKNVDWVPRPFGPGDVPMESWECVCEDATGAQMDACFESRQSCSHYVPAVERDYEPGEGK